MKQKIRNVVSRLVAKPCTHQVGLALVYLGAVLLIVAYLLGWTGSNILLLVCLFLIAAGIVLHVMIQKRSSRY